MNLTFPLVIQLICLELDKRNENLDNCSNSNIEKRVFKIELKCDTDYLDTRESDCDNVNYLINDNSHTNCDNITLERKSKGKKSPVS